MESTSFEQDAKNETKQMNRDPKTGRFLPGNQAAVGNRGNTRPKWLNANALKHGLYSRSLVIHRIKSDGCLYFTKMGKTIKVYPEGFYKNDEGIFLRDDVVEQLKGIGFIK